MSEFSFNHLDDVSFNLTLYELAHGPVRFNNDRLECLYFNPISNCDTVISSDIDPDSNFLNLTSKCSYYNEQELNDLIGNKKDAINFSLLHLNARSLLKNFDKFTQLLDSSQHEFSAIGISETWLNDINEDYVNITGYRSSHGIEWAGLVEAQAFIYATLSTLTLCLICACQTPPYLTLFLLKSKIRIEKTLLSVQFIVLLLLICMNSWNLFTNCFIG